MNDLKRFEKDLRDRVDERYIKEYKKCKYRPSHYYNNNEHQNKNENYVLFLAKDDLTWEKYIKCKKCCEDNIQNIGWSDDGYIINARYFVNGNEMMTKMINIPLNEAYPILKFYTKNIRNYDHVTFILKKSDFNSNFFEQFFYEHLYELITNPVKSNDYDNSIATFFDKLPIEKVSGIKYPKTCPDLNEYIELKNKYKFDLRNY